jgi:uncharacterized membrane protein
MNSNAPGQPPGLPAPVSAPKAARPRLFSRLRDYFLAGLLVTAPISITIYLTWSFISWVDDSILPLLPAAYNPENYLRFDVPGVGLIHLTLPGIGLVIAIVFLIVIGALAAGLVGRLFLDYSERVLNHMPIVRSIYGATKQIFEIMLM